MTAPEPQLAVRALADPTRRDILCLLADQDMTIAEVSDRFDMTRAAVKKHLTVLAEGDLIVVSPRGRERVNRFNPAGFAPVRDWIGFFDRFWDDRLTALKDTIDNKDKK